MLGFSPSPMQVLILWKMVFMNEQPTFSKVKKSDRQPLINAGLVSTYKKGRTSFMQLEDSAWDWTVQNLDAKVSDRSPQSGPVLQQVLTLLKKYMQQNNISLHEFMKAEATAEPPAAPGETVVELDQASIVLRVRETYFTFTNGKPHVSMRLATLREILSDIPRPNLDEALKEMKRNNQIHLFPFEDPQQKNETDDWAALYEASRLNHIIIFED